MWTPLSSLLRSRMMRLATTVVLAATLYWAADWPAVVDVLGRLTPWYLLAALLLFVPQTFVSALRWRAIVSRWASLALAESVRQTLVASAANLALPSKLGDFSKSAMLPADATRSASIGPRLVVLEKVADVAALLVVLALGFAGCPWPVILALALIFALLTHTWPSPLAGEGSGVRSNASNHFTSKRDHATVAAISVTLWCLHIWQIDLCLRAAGIFVTSDIAAARIPLALFAGVVPISLWGVGTRDAALMALFSDVASPAPLAAVGLLTALRYLVPGACGVLLLARRSANRAAADGSASVDASTLLTPVAATSSR